MQPMDQRQSSYTTGVTTRLQREKGILEFCGSSYVVAAVRLDEVGHSSLLRDLVASSGECAEASLPVTWRGLHLWLDHIQKVHAVKTLSPAAISGISAAGGAAESSESGTPSDDDSTSEEAEARHGAFAGGPGSMDALCDLMKVADVLIDDNTKVRCAEAIAWFLQRPPWETASTVPPAVAALPEHLQASVLSHTPLPHCLRNLLRSWHPAALRAHHPSVDAHATLALPRLPIAAVHAALSAAATLTALRALSLAGLTLPLDVAPCIRLLGELTALTALNLHDIGLRQPTAAALAAVLPALPQLESLDLSSNLLSASTLQALTPALQRCTALHSLNLWHTLRLLEGDECSLEGLVCAVEAMPRLTFFALGHYGGSKQVDPVERNPPGAACSALLESLRSQPQLQEAKLQLFKCHRQPVDAARAFNAVAALAHLQTLDFTFPQVQPSVHAPQLHVAALTNLTTIRLEFLAGRTREDVGNTAEFAAAAVAGLPRLPHLQRLWLNAPIRRNHEEPGEEPCVTLARVLPQLAHLSHLHLAAAPTDEHHCVPVDPGALSVKAVIHAALRMPVLRVLHLPISVAGRDAELPACMTALAHAAQAGVQLSVDLYVREIDSTAPCPLPDYLPLFPYLRSLDVWCVRGDVLLQPLLDRQAELTQIRELTIEAEVENLPDSVLIAFMQKTSSLTTLEQLCCSVEAVPEDSSTVESDPVPLDLEAFASSVRCLTRLTELRFYCGGFIECDHLPLLSACRGLPELQVLDLGSLEEWGDDICGGVLTRLRVKALHVTEPQNQWQLILAMNTLGRLYDLRTLDIAMLHDRQEAERATAQLPAFQMLR